MRVILDECGYTWDAAWDIVTRTVSYTNHTVMPEALECWDQEMFRRRLPRIYQIIEEINRRFCAQMHDLGVDGYQVGRMAVLNEGIVRMANLAVAASHSVNGVSRLHTEILKDLSLIHIYLWGEGCSIRMSAGSWVGIRQLFENPEQSASSEVSSGLS